MTSQTVMRDLRKIDWLIGLLNAPGGVDEEDLDDLRWLQARRRYLQALLATRRAQRETKIVSLSLWRHGVVA